jgi:hypothetical protein
VLIVLVKPHLPLSLLTNTVATTESGAHCHICCHLCRASRSWPRSSQPPIIFMGLLDTVGAEGIPRIKPQGDPASAFTYEYNFRDLVVSSEVQHVFQAASTHDRLAPFEPCAVRRSDKMVGGAEGKGSSSSGSSTGHYPGVEFSLQEVWFPGKHCSQACWVQHWIRCAMALLN